MVSAQKRNIDVVLPRVERRVKRLIIDALVEQVKFVRGIHARTDARKRCFNDAGSYHAQACTSAGTLEERHKAGNKLEELNERTVEPVYLLHTASRCCTTLVDLPLQTQSSSAVSFTSTLLVPLNLLSIILVRMS